MSCAREPRDTAVKHVAKDAVNQALTPAAKRDEDCLTAPFSILLEAGVLNLEHRPSVGPWELSHRVGWPPGRLALANAASGRVSGSLSSCPMEVEHERKSRCLELRPVSKAGWHMWVGSRAKALEDLRELDELLEDELIEEETHATQLQHILTEFGVKSREELLKGEPGEPAPAPEPPEEFPKEEEAQQARVQLLQEQLQELDELLEDELIEEEVHAEQRKHLLAALAREGHQP
ncbi:unnamed protein product [Cladocopium goreaui]|uniref:Uncharacterized protein n=1 Tax=Cladocopium goreaui TaxID=2562237 RepID=A0A9P1BQP6_9DINO|nr:unnamed protein product [Cladocopium goreaui]